MILFILAILNIELITYMVSYRGYTAIGGEYFILPVIYITAFIVKNRRKIRRSICVNGRN